MIHRVGALTHKVMGVCLSILGAGGGGLGGSCQNLGRYVPPGLSKIGSPEKSFAKICVSGAKNWSWNARFVQKFKWGLWSGKKKSLKRGSPELKCGLIKGVLRVTRPRITFQCESPYHLPKWVPPPHYQYIKSSGHELQFPWGKSGCQCSKRRSLGMRLLKILKHW